MQQGVVGRPQSRIDGFSVGETALAKARRHDLKPALVDHLLAAPLQMDRKAFGQMKRGKLKPEGRIDLHGMTMDRAHPALTRFILSSQASGRRLVLRMELEWTGKGSMYIA